MIKKKHHIGIHLFSDVSSSLERMKPLIGDHDQQLQFNTNAYV
jgi:hypothetical protein